MQLHHSFFIKTIVVSLLCLLTSCTDTQKTTQTKDDPLVQKEEPSPNIDIEPTLDTIAIQKRRALLERSFLKEFYHREVVTFQNDTLYTVIPFDLHGNDCEAPDCYITTVQFQFTMKEDQIQFPKTLPFQELETGCVPQETIRNGIFELKEATPDVVIYYARTLDKTLVLCSNTTITEDYAYYFDTMPYTITSKNWHTLLDNFDETEHISYPYRSQSLSNTNKKEIL